METLETHRPAYQDNEFPVIVMPNIASGAQPNGWHEDLEIKLIRSDKLYISIDSQIHLGKPNEIFLINPYQIHSVPHISGIDMRYDLIMIRLDFFSITGIHAISLRKIFMEDHICFNNHITNPHLIDILEKIVEAFPRKNDPYIRIRIQAFLMEFFSVLLCEEITERKDSDFQNNIRYYNTIAPALEEIHRSYDSKIKSEELAHKCKVSHSYFCRIFKQLMGVTPVQYLIENRLRLADILIKDGNHTITDIAHMVGFDDETYFSRCYKKFRGIAPGKASRQSRQK